MEYSVQPGDCVSSIAFQNGFFWKTLWNLPENAALKAQRKNPNVLMTGDVVSIPAITVKQLPYPDGKRYTFVRKGVPEKLNIQLLDYNQKPRAGLDYVLFIEGDSWRGKTDREGRIKAAIPPDAKSGKLVFAGPPILDAKGNPLPDKPKDQTMILQLGNLNPVSETSGLKARLVNLGFLKGPIDEKLNAATQNAIRQFQTKMGLPSTGTADDATRQKLLALHGH
jgi:N-acetylmuramoyl-L-alanine amidase